MAFIGNTNTTQAFTPAVDFFSGNASTTAFTLSRPVASVAQVQAVVNNVPQKPSDAFTVSGNTITFTSAPSSGTNNIYVYYTSPITQVIAPGQGTVGPVQLDYATLNGTGALTMPSGTTAQRPGSPTVGMMRYNTTESKYEVYTSAGWQFLSSTAYTYNIDYLVVAGGGGGGAAGGGGGAGGGAGGFRTGTSFSVSGGTNYIVTVGAGGARGTTGQSGATGDGTNGSDSVFSTITSTGGGGGAAGGLSRAGKSGGSGGGAGQGASTAVGGAGNTPSVSPSQGNNGGAYTNTSYNGAGGGGGASAVGAAPPSVAVGGAGGAGTASSISGSSVTYAGGGGGASNTTGGAGGAGGGGTGGAINGTAGTANLGGGGGGGYGSTGVAAAGGSGVVILSIPTVNFTGTVVGSATVTTSGSNTILTFTGSGSYTA